MEGVVSGGLAVLGDAVFNISKLLFGKISNINFKTQDTWKLEVVQSPLPTKGEEMIIGYISNQAQAAIVIHYSIFSGTVPVDEPVKYPFQVPVRWVSDWEQDYDNNGGSGRQIEHSAWSNSEL